MALELIDLEAAVRMLADDLPLPAHGITGAEMLVGRGIWREGFIDEKRAKVEVFLAYSRELGTLQP